MEKGLNDWARTWQNSIGPGSTLITMVPLIDDECVIWYHAVVKLIGSKKIYEFDVAVVPRGAWHKTKIKASASSRCLPQVSINKQRSGSYAPHQLKHIDSVPTILEKPNAVGH
jgi:hypothetical protein